MTASGYLERHEKRGKRANYHCSRPVSTYASQDSCKPGLVAGGLVSEWMVRALNSSTISVVLKKAGGHLLCHVADQALKSAERLESASLLTRQMKSVVARNTRFANAHENQRAFVIANGPSLREQDIAPLADEITFVVSGFWKHPVVEDWQPTYYCLLDKHFFQSSQPTREFYRDLNERISRSVFFLPLFRGYDANNKHRYVDPEQAFYVASFGRPSLSVDITRFVQSFAGVSAFALAIALFMGCNPIYLLGCDHDYLANRGIDQHFYDGPTITGSISAQVALGELIPYDQEMEAFLRLWNNYRSLATIAKHRGIDIYNATLGGYLDVYPRIKFESLNF